MAERYILALDQGTTSSRAILFDRAGKPVCTRSKEIEQIYPRPGWVEHDPEEIWASQIGTARGAMDQAGVAAGRIAGIGITNQRETTIVWERETGKPVCNAIVWQCRRTADMCEVLKETAGAERIRRRTGLFVDAYFSGTKVRWILDNVPGARRRAESGELLFGTVDSWLVYNLTGRKVHVTDHSNASRTLIFNIYEKKWDEEMMGHLGIPPPLLPQVRTSSGVCGHSDPSILGGEIPISGIAGDQQAALFGQACFERGAAKNTYGTGSFMLMNIGERAIHSENGLVTSIAWGLDGRVEYALEGSIFIAGAAVGWLRDGLEIIESAEESEFLARSVEDNGGVYFVPAFVGLGAPHWDMYARGAIFGLTRGSTKAHVARAALESVAYQIRDVFEGMKADSGLTFRELKVDGGATVNRFLMQFQADILGIPVVCAGIAETTALGAAYLAGLGVGYWADQDEISQNWRSGEVFEPKMSESSRQWCYEGWKKAVERAKRWDEGA
ncbi:MAG: glycerol kinase GlpK [Nitrospinota bacterium]